MNILKRTQILFIVLVLLITSIQPIWGATDEQIQAGNKLRVLKILNGYEDGTLRLDQNISRAEIATILIRVLGYEDSIIAGMSQYKFDDVPESHWASQNIKKAAKLGLVSGYPDGTFKPNKPISYAEITAMMVRLVNQDKDVEGSWPYNYINKGRQIGIVKEENIDFNRAVSRGEVAVFLWDTLLVKIK